MLAEEKKKLEENLTQAHLAIRTTLEKVDMDMSVYQDSGWCVRDIIGHIATWDRETARSLRAYQKGAEYLTPDLDEEEVEFNDRSVQMQRKLSVQQLVDEFEQAYQEFRDTIQEMSADHFPGDMLYPWGDERGDIATLVEYMVDHAVEHHDEIKKAVAG